jgi:hypothetical protein
MLKQILAIAVIALAAFTAYAAMQPDEMSITRSATFIASQDALFEQINNLQKWNAWSPWAKLDPNTKTTFEGPAAGVGAKMSWVSDDSQVGSGSMTITDSRSNELIRFKLDFLKPFPGIATNEFTIKADGGQTMVTWTMNGHRNLIAKAMGLIFNCDKMVGGMFEKGLANLKAIVETK